jgi:hypothetical protein
MSWLTFLVIDEDSNRSGIVTAAVTGTVTRNEGVGIEGNVPTSTGVLFV